MRYLMGALCLITVVLGACAGYQSQEPARVVSVGPKESVSAIEESYGLKRKVAIGRFTNDSRVATSFLNEGSNGPEKLSRAANDILSAKLAKTNKFLLIERNDQLAISNEQSISNITTYQIPADYLILGSISEFGRSTSGNVGLIDRTKMQTAFAKVTIRIVDTRTGLVIFGEEGSGEASIETGTVLGMGSSAGYDDSLTDKAIDAAINSVINSLINKLSNDPWRSYILTIEDAKVYISGGALQGIKAGDQFTVYKRGSVVINPQTNTPIELPGSKVARIAVEQVIAGTELTEMSIAKIIEGELSGSDFSAYYISDK